MTQADTAHAVRRSLDSGKPPGQAALMTTPLPDGWTSFCSTPDPRWDRGGQWYATAPYLAYKVHGAESRHGPNLAQTVCASTWPALHLMVAAEVKAYRELTGEE